MLTDIVNVDMIGFIYIIVVIEFEITIITKIDSINSFVLITDIIVFNFGMNPNKGGTPMSENIVISIPKE